MSKNTTRLLATCAIWIATALIFIRGYFDRLDVRGAFPTFIWATFGIALALSPALATRAVWKTRDDDKSGVDGDTK